MRNVRRLYFYLVTFISIELVIWGTITLLQTLLDTTLNGTANILASGLASVLVGIPIFLLHASVIQRDATRDPEERANRLRAIFFYAVRLATIVPVVQGGISVVTRLAASLLGLPTSPSFIGMDQSLVNHLAAMAVNGLAWVYAGRLLRREEQAVPESSALDEVRRLYRYLWMLYTLVLAVFGIGSILWYVLYIPGPAEFYNGGASELVNGLGLTLLGAPLWALAWTNIQRSLVRQVEIRSLLRLVVLYFLTVGPALVVVISAVNSLAGLLNLVFGQNQTLANYLLSYRWAISTLLPLGVVWVFFQHALDQAWIDEPNDLRKAALARLYHTLLSLLGNAVTFFGAWQLLLLLVDLATAGLVFTGGLSSQLSLALSSLGIGLLTWLPNWQFLQLEAGMNEDRGDHARRSILRRSSFYLVIFLSVVGVMVNAGTLFYRLINALLGNLIPNLAVDLAHTLVSLVLCAVWLAYHLSSLRQDGRRAQLALTARHAAFPVLVFSNGDSEFSRELDTALHAIVPRLPVTWQQAGDEIPLSADPAQFKTVILPADIELLPSGETGTWLSGLTEQRLIVPLPAPGKIWMGLPPRTPRELARETALALRQLAEGEPLRPTAPNNPWVIAGYVFGGLFALELLLVIFVIVMNFFSSSRF